MGRSRFHLLSCFLVIFASLLIPNNCKNDLPWPQRHVALFIFGDSIFDVGNNNYINTTTDFQSNFWPYGETTFKFPSGRVSDGRIIPDFIAEYANLPYILPYLQPGVKHYVHGVNFASAGAGALVATYRGFVIDLKTQLSYFSNVKKLLKKRLGDAKAKILLSRAVYLISIGGNDYISPFVTNSGVLQTHSHKEYADMVIGNLTTVLRGIYKQGGRKFGFLNMGPIGCLPSGKLLVRGNTGACMEELTALANLHNRLLPSALHKLSVELEGFKYSITDSYTSGVKIINNPEKYGLKEGKIACCGSGPYRGAHSCGGRRSIKEFQLCNNSSEYVFFDAGHGTERTNQLLAELMWSGSTSITSPLNLKALFE